MVGAQNTGLGGLSAQSLSSLLENLQKQWFCCRKIGVGVRVGAQNTGLGGGGGGWVWPKSEFSMGKYSKTKNGFCGRKLEHL